MLSLVGPQVDAVLEVETIFFFFFVLKRFNQSKGLVHSSDNYVSRSNRVM